jgi:hypothetical protein
MTQAQPEIVRLFVHKTLSEEDKKALELFEVIKRELKTETSVYRDAKFLVEELDAESEFRVPTLPCLLNGTYWNGLHQIKLFLKYYRGYEISAEGE